VSYRRKLLLAFTVTVLLSVTTVAAISLYVTERAFETAEGEHTRALVAQFRREFARRGREILQRVQNIGASEAARQMADSAARSPLDYAPYVNHAKTIAGEQQLDFLELVDARGTIWSSAQWPAKFGYKETSFSPTSSTEAALRQQETPEGAELGLFAVTKTGGDTPLYVIGGQRLDKDFLTSLELPEGMRVFLYQNVGGGALVDPSGKPTDSGKVSALIRQAITGHSETSAIVNWTSNSSDDEVIHAIPLNGDDNRVLGVLLAGASRRPYVELRRHIGSAALLAVGSGLALAILFSSWAAGRVTRPVVQLAETAREVAAGNWYAQAEVSSSDELGELAGSFNRMTRELLDQRERLVQTERVAAWRELARRLAHELKNPLFPLQLTVENLLRARQQSPEQFEEIFQESASTLLAEIANLKAVIGRFSDFARMPHPQLQLVDLNEIARGVMNLFQAQCATFIDCKLELAEGLPQIEADPELLHRALSNLVLNAMDAMSQGGVLSIATQQQGERAFLSVSDTGVGLTPEECERIFTPYYTSKTHGTGLGLAIVQSVISDHHGRVSVTSKPGNGTTFVIELPMNSFSIGKG
jgi:two-component system, NtrC family, nitrogen regulation sensor histidine kinase NtrY